MGTGSAANPTQLCIPKKALRIPGNLQMISPPKHALQTPTIARQALQCRDGNKTIPYL